MVCSTEFFMKTLPRIVDDRVSLVLTPQAYHNYDPATDIFNHSAYDVESMGIFQCAATNLAPIGSEVALDRVFARCG